MESIEYIDGTDSVEDEPLKLPDLGAFKTETRIDLSFCNVTYMVRRHLLTNERKKILHNISGEFKAGELTAIMGPSGAGKSALMNILASYITGKGVTGDIRANGRTRELSSYRRSIAYIMQDDHLHTQLTVLESMIVAARLKLSGSLKFKMDRIQFVMRLMGLEKVASSFTQDLSGGQRKRLVIAYELLGDSSVMFFDEPTSHLDSVTSRQCVEMLKQLAEGGRNVVCTIHQPSATLFNMFDHLYVVAGGRCIYDGRTDTLLPYLETLGFQCPTYHNPSDFMLDIASGEFGDNIEKMSEASLKFKKRLSTQSRAPSEGKKIKVADSPSGFWTQLSVLLYSNLVRIYRNRDLPMSIILSHLGMAIFLGCLYWNIGKDATRMQDNAKLSFFMMVYLSFCALSSTLQSFPDEMPALDRETFNGWYSVHALYLAKKLTYMLVTTTCTIVYVIIVFFMTNQLFEWDRFAMVLLQCFLIGVISLSVGIAFGAALPPKISVFLGIYSLMPHLLFSGLYIRCRDTFYVFQKLFDYSIFKNGIEGIMLAIYGYDRPRFECEGICVATSPKLILKEYDMEHADYWYSTAYLTLFYLAVNLLTYIILVFRLRR